MTGDRTTRRRYAIANWKMNLPPEGLDAYFGALGSATNDVQTNDVQTVIAPPFPYLGDAVRLAGDALAVAAQNCADHASGAYTGEVAPSMIRDRGARYVILGHSERRQLFGEHDALIGRKLALAIETGLVPVLCIGEDLRVRDAGHVARHLADQIKTVAVPALASADELVVAYEPVWAIGTGRNASGAMVAETVREIRKAVEHFWPERWRDVSILYGGSVTPENVEELVAEGQIDGFLVGGASLDSGKFGAIRASLSRA